MRKFSLVFFILLLTIAALAEPWRQKGNTWTANGVSLRFPPSVKAKADSTNVLGAEGNSISMTFQFLPEAQNFKSFSAASMKRLESFKNIRWSEPQFSVEDNLSMSMRVGRFEDKGVRLQFALCSFERGKVKLATMTVQVTDHQPSSQIIGQVMNSIQFR